MKAKIVLTGVELKHIDQLKVKLEKMVVNYGIELDDDSKNTVFVRVVDRFYEGGGIIEKPFVIAHYGIDKNFSFSLY